MLIDRKMFRRAAHKAIPMTPKQAEALDSALQDREKVDNLTRLMVKEKAVRFQRLQSLITWVIANRQTILQVLGILIMFADEGPEEPDAKSRRRILRKANRHKSEEVQSVGGTQGGDAGSVSGPGELQSVPVAEGDSGHRRGDGVDPEGSPDGVLDSGAGSSPVSGS